MYHLFVYVPEKYLEKVKKAMFEAGGGAFKNYDYCCWQTKGLGQFRPNEGSSPFLGNLDKVHFEKEWKVEFIVEEDNIEKVIDAMKKSHPYEVVAYSVIKTLDF